MSDKSYISHVIETEDGELAITLPHDVLAQMGWTEDTDLFWDIDSDGSIMLKETKHEDRNRG
jgi:antitoxin component of MazEF toxin-antitoxin module